MSRGYFFRGWKKRKAVVISACAVALVASFSTIALWEKEDPMKEPETEMEGFSDEYVMDDQKEPEMPPTIKETKTSETPEQIAQMTETEMPETDPVEVAENSSVDEVQEVAGDQNAVANLTFAPDSLLSWPLQGEVIVEYSPDATIYFQTLKQYQTSDGMAVASATDAPVAAACDGVVSKVGFEDEIGSFVEMDLGNGYSLVYGQLKDISVTEGQFVEAGATFAKVNQPTRYYQVEGANLYLQMKTPEGTADPLDYLR